MKTLLFIIARNIHHRAQRITEAYLRRAVLHPGAISPGKRRRPFYFQQIRSSRSYLKPWR